MKHLQIDSRCACKRREGACGTPCTMSRVCDCSSCLCEHRELECQGDPEGPCARGRDGQEQGCCWVCVEGKMLGQIWIKEKDKQENRISPICKVSISTERVPFASSLPLSPADCLNSNRGLVFHFGSVVLSFEGKGERESRNSSLQPHQLLKASVSVL